MRHDLAPCHNSISIEHSYHCKGILILEFAGNSPEINFKENVWNTMKKEIGKQMSCKKKRC